MKLEEISSAMMEVCCNIGNLNRFNGSQTQNLGILRPKDLHWRCVRCHACCGDTKEHIRHIKLLETEAITISRFTNRQPKSFCANIDKFGRYKFEMLKQRSGECVFLRGDSCTIYPERPLTCRFYPFFLERTAEGRYKFGLTNENCPGLGQGPLLDTEFFAELFKMASKKMQSG